MEERGFVFQQENLSSPADAVAAFFARVKIRAPSIEHVSLEEAFGRVLAAPMAADDDYPNAPRSAMDGFAIDASHAPGRLRIAGEIRMGHPWSGALDPGETVRIPTGGVVPGGADAVVPIEECAIVGNTIVIERPFATGENVNPQGSDMRKNETVLFPGRIGAAALGVFATLGVTGIPVFRRPVIGIVSSGDELIPPESMPKPGQIRDSNRYAIAGALEAMGAIPRHLATIPDSPELLEKELRSALALCDAVILSGGSSVGERDFTPKAIASLGEPGVIVHGLRVKPGKPTVLAAIGRKPVIGLPGNPLSALVILEAVAAPIVAALAGGALPQSPIQAQLAQPLRSRSGWTWYIPVTLQHEAGAWTAHPLALRSSSTSLAARADGYVTMGEEAETWDAGRSVAVTRFA
jgi:molybdopterin molybdotransferase